MKISESLITRRVRTGPESDVIAGALFADLSSRGSRRDPPAAV